jgi:hypothetical protein
MTVKCPNYGHSGKLPSNMESGPHKIRCPKCGVRFETQPGEVVAEGLSDPEIDPNGLSDLAADLGIEPELESDEEATELPGVGVGNLKLDVSHDEIPVQSEPREELPPEPWFYGFLDGWGMFYFCAAGITFVVLVAFVLLMVTGGASTVGGFPVGFLIVGAAIIALFGTFLITSAAVIFLVVDQARNIRRLQDRAEQLESILRRESRMRD